MIKVLYLRKEQFSKNHSFFLILQPHYKPCFFLLSLQGEIFFFI